MSDWARNKRYYTVELKRLGVNASQQLQCAHVAVPKTFGTLSVPRYKWREISKELQAHHRVGILLYYYNTLHGVVYAKGLYVYV